MYRPSRSRSPGGKRRRYESGAPPADGVGRSHMYGSGYRGGSSSTINYNVPPGAPNTYQQPAYGGRDTTPGSSYHQGRSFESNRYDQPRFHHGGGDGRRPRSRDRNFRRHSRPGRRFSGGHEDYYHPGRGSTPRRSMSRDIPRHANSEHGSSRRGNRNADQPLTLEQWARTQPPPTAASTAEGMDAVTGDNPEEKTIEEKYQEYVEEWQQRKDEYFVMEHEDEDWFLSKYSLDQRLEHRQDRVSKARETAKKLMESFQHDSDGTIPVLEASSRLVESVAENSRKRRSNRTLASTPIESKDLIGEEIDGDRYVYLSHIPKSVSQDLLLTSLKAKALEVWNVTNESSTASNSDQANDGNMAQDCPTVDLFIGEVNMQRRGSDTNNFSRPGWVLCGDKLLAEKLIAVGQLCVRLPSSDEEETEEAAATNPDTDAKDGAKSDVEMSRLDDKHVVKITMEKKRTLGNRICPVEASMPERVVLDLEQATKLGRALDREIGIGTNSNTEESDEPNESFMNCGIDAMLASDACNKYLGEKKEQESTATSYIRTCRKLDLVLTYLRRVHLTCYYSHLRFENVGSMLRLSAVPFVRKPLLIAQEQRAKRDARNAPKAGIVNDESHVNSTAEKESKATNNHNDADKEVVNTEDDNKEGADKEEDANKEDDNKEGANKEETLSNNADGKKTVAASETEMTEAGDAESSLDKLLDSPNLAELVGARSDSRWIKSLDRGIQELLESLSEESLKAEREQEEADSQQLEKLKETGIESFCKQNTKTENGAFRCLLPPYKLFKSEEFVHKYIRSKHKNRLVLVEKMAAKTLTSEIYKREARKQRLRQKEHQKRQKEWTVERTSRHSMGSSGATPARRKPRGGGRFGGSRRGGGVTHAHQHPAVSSSGNRTQWAGGRRYNDYDAPPATEKTVDIQYRTKVDYSDL